MNPDQEAWSVLALVLIAQVIAPVLIVWAGWAIVLWGHA